jgi:predicted nucleotidyltransferase component of viral defense system
VLNSQLVEEVAAELGTAPGLIEKEWHVVRAIAVVSALDQGEARPVFSGGTSLSVGWGLIQRFSEDADFKVVMPAAANPSQGRARRREFRERVLAALTAADFRLIGPVRKASRFFSANLAYPNGFNLAVGFRPYLQIEMTFEAPTLPTIDRPIHSLIARAQDRDPEIPAFPCVDPVETAADKLSALAWRVCARERGSPKDDPTIVRHLHDLAALESRVATAPAFTTLLLVAAAADSGRGGGRVPIDASDRFSMMLDRLGTDPVWADEYDRFVQNVSFAASDEIVRFDKALEAAKRLATTAGVIARSS